MINYWQIEDCDIVFPTKLLNIIFMTFHKNLISFLVIHELFENLTGWGKNGDYFLIQHKKKIHLESPIRFKTTENKF